MVFLNWFFFSINSSQNITNTMNINLSRKEASATPPKTEDCLNKHQSVTEQKSGSDKSTDALGKSQSNAERKSNKVNLTVLLDDTHPMTVDKAEPMAGGNSTAEKDEEGDEHIDLIQIYQLLESQHRDDSPWSIHRAYYYNTASISVEATVYQHANSTNSSQRAVCGSEMDKEDFQG
jgi:hypothetical protein